MDTAIAPATLSYLTALSLVSTPLPQTSLSSSASRSLSSLLPAGLTPALLATKCRRCRAEIVGGINGSYRMEGGSLWAYCEGCGWSSRRVGTTAEGRAGDGQGGGTQMGKSAFGRIKRRRLGERSLVAAHGRPEQAMVRGGPASRTPTPLSEPPTRRGTPSYTPTSTSPAPPALPTPPREAASTDPSTASPRQAPEQRPPAPSPAVASSITATPAKKKKRAKQPGLAELLAAKKRENARAAGGGVALSDFLEGM